MPVAKTRPASLHMRTRAIAYDPHRDARETRKDNGQTYSSEVTNATMTHMSTRPAKS